MSVWGETADPDKDGLSNLLEYATDTDPTMRNPVTDCYVFSVPEAGAPHLRYPQITAYLRQDDPDLRVIPQTSGDLTLWTPSAPVDFTQPQPPSPAVWAQETGTTLRGLRQMRYIDQMSLAQRDRAFMRLMVVRRGAVVTSSAIDPFTFTPGQTVATGSTARSSAIVLVASRETSR